MSALRDALGGAAVRRELTCCYVKEMISFTQEARTSDTSGGGRECEARGGEERWVRLRQRTERDELRTQKASG